MDRLLHFLNLTLDWFNSVPGHWYYTAGVVLASILASPMVVQGFKKLHVKHYSKEMTDVLVDFTITVTAALMALADFLLTNSNNMVTLLPFLAVAIPTIKAFAPTVYNISKTVHAFAVDRKAKKAITNVNKPELQPLVESVTSTSTVSGQPSSSFGSASAGVDVIAPSAPPENLFL